MLTEAIHRRIMLNELREILVDTERPHGGHLPSEMADGLDLDSVTSFLIAADWFEQQGSELENLIRTHCELIELMPMDWCLDRHYENHDGMGRYPFLVDSYFSRMHEQNDFDWSHRTRLLMSRLSSYDSIYGIPRKFSPPSKWELQLKRSGRTTRMLTDVIRRCYWTPRHLSIQVVSQQGLRQTFADLCFTLGLTEYGIRPREIMVLGKTNLMFFEPNDARIEIGARNPNIYTATDHYVVEQRRRPHVTM